MFLFPEIYGLSVFFCREGTQGLHVLFQLHLYSTEDFLTYILTLFNWTQFYIRHKCTWLQWWQSHRHACDPCLLIPLIVSNVSHLTLWPSDHVYFQPFDSMTVDPPLAITISAIFLFVSSDCIWVSNSCSATRLTQWNCSGCGEDALKWFCLLAWTHLPPVTSWKSFLLFSASSLAVAGVVVVSVWFSSPTPASSSSLTGFLSDKQNVRI